MSEKCPLPQTDPFASSENVRHFGRFRFTVITDRIVRVEEDGTETFCDLPTQAVWFRNCGAVGFTFRADGQTVEIVTSAATYRIDIADFSASTVTFAGEKRARKVSAAGNLGGTLMSLDTREGKYLTVQPEVTEFKRENIRWPDGVASRSGVAVLDDSASWILCEDGVLRPRGKEEKDRYIFAFGHDYRAAVRGLYALCGGLPMLPRYTLGNWWSRFYPYSEESYMELLDRFEFRNIPLSVATVDMDWHWVDVSRKYKNDKKTLENTDWSALGGWSGFSWNTELFPDYPRFLRRVRERGLKVALNLHPESGMRWFEDQYEAVARRNGVDPATKQTVGFDLQSPTYINSMFEYVYRPYEENGVDLWWLDVYGNPIVWQLNHAHYLNICRNKRGVILSRYAGVGGHRYPIGFTGDTLMSWDFLKLMPYFTATSANVGQVWWSHDIGGHMQGIKDNELYIRWLQYGVFSPINRLHSCNLHVVTKEPWANDRAIELLAADLLRLRHKLVPYIYTYAERGYASGEALIEPLYYEYPETEEAYSAEDEYFFGRELLAAPVTQRTENGYAVRSVWLPEGEWTDIFLGTRYRGGRTLRIARTLSEMPVFARAGAIIPLSGDEGNGTANPALLDVWVFDGQGEFTMFEDDEESGAALRTHFSVRTERKEKEGRAAIRNVFTVEAEGDAEVVPADRRYRIWFRNARGGKVCARRGGAEEEVRIRTNECLNIAFAGSGKWEIVVEREEDAAGDIVREMGDFLCRAEGDNVQKDLLYSALKNAGNEQQLQKIIDESGLPEPIKIRLREPLMR